MSGARVYFRWLMPLQEIDISWQLLRRIVRDWAGEAAELTEIKPLVGGQINTTIALHLADNTRAVLKISPHRVNRDFQREAEQLGLLRQKGIPTPEVYNCHIGSLEHPHSYLLMEFVEGVDLGVAKKQCDAKQYEAIQRHLAELVATIHSCTAAEYHRIAGEDLNRFESWPHFYRHVYDPIWRDIEKSPSIPPKVRKQIHRIHERLDRLVVHEDCPRLVHWDIWRTNVLTRADAQGNWRVAALLDPNCKFAHAEAEIAYLDLFQTITPAFLNAYQQVHRLDEGYHRVRKPIYQLYPLINHVHLFGHDYVKPLLAAVERAAPLV